MSSRFCTLNSSERHRAAQARALAAPSARAIVMLLDEIACVRSRLTPIEETLTQLKAEMERPAAQAAQLRPGSLHRVAHFDGLRSY